MTFWTSERLQAQGHVLVQPFNARQVRNCSYELTLGGEAYVTGSEPHGTRFLADQRSQLSIPPGQFALLLTEETVSIPPNTIGFISLKSLFKLHGLVNVSGFHVDPGFRGRLVFSVYNAGGQDLLISRGERLFLLWLSSLEDETADRYQGPRQQQRGISNQDIMAIGRQHYSPAAVDERLTSLEVKIETAYRIVVAILIGLVLAGAGFFIRALSNNGDPGVSSPAPAITATHAVPGPTISKPSP